MKANQRHYLDNHVLIPECNMKTWRIHPQRSGVVLRRTADPDLYMSCFDSGYAYYSSPSSFREASGPLEGGTVAKSPECILLLLLRHLLYAQYSIRNSNRVVGWLLRASRNYRISSGLNNSEAPEQP